MTDAATAHEHRRAHAHRAARGRFAHNAGRGHLLRYARLQTPGAHSCAQGGAGGARSRIAHGRLKCLPLRLWRRRARSSQLHAPAPQAAPPPAHTVAPSASRAPLRHPVVRTGALLTRIESRVVEERVFPRAKEAERRRGARVFAAQSGASAAIRALPPLGAHRHPKRAGCATPRRLGRRLRPPALRAHAKGRRGTPTFLFLRALRGRVFARRRTRIAADGRRQGPGRPTRAFRRAQSPRRQAQSAPRTHRPRRRAAAPPTPTRRRPRPRRPPRRTATRLPRGSRAGRRAHAAASRRRRALPASLPTQVQTCRLLFFFVFYFVCNALLAASHTC